MTSNQILIHVHIPKTGGTTLNKIINNNYNDGLIKSVYDTDESVRNLKFKELSKKNISCIEGHFPFGIHAYFNVPYVYITLLRNPIDRVISEYYFTHSFSWPSWLDKNNPDHKKYFNLSLEDFIKYPAMRNKQTRFISGNFNTELLDCDLNKAIENIEKYFIVAGTTEMFDESVFLMKEMLGWKNSKYIKSNVTKKRPKLNDLTSDIRQLIEEYNKFDLELYSFAKRRLMHQIGKLDEKTKEKLHVYLEQVNK
ncbi:sulfotransferase family 2 domain-containing protein [Bacillus sp. ISL-47]|uniref:sulfotransferase family 2 domain-containing protein n=1 Tax=Bacillus sp. ISL-47 TaxID=2819130 RepID=UPI001BE74E8B|nr:sulfotransferase family 2 domain-containing protein [Bacillus sp. ISL-47]MBT2686890.1 sulfotransferase family 2 domain-containing protein [Bacillus sp. ISL-47]MBT2710429.1 sulfotransferase family 2 domain-containing protein [Pseudomonas sp. ISL-84]